MTGRLMSSVGRQDRIWQIRQLIGTESLFYPNAFIDLGSFEQGLLRWLLDVVEMSNDSTVVVAEALAK